jgi:HSP20 family protein
MATPRWDPFHEMQSFREAMERFMQDGIMRPASNFIPGMRGGTIPVDVIERDEAYVVRAALPGVRPEDASVTLQGHVLTIRGEIGTASVGQGQRWLLHELRGGSFYRTVSLPATVDTEQSTARFRQGILELTLPKQATMRPRQIQIQGSGTQPSSIQDDEPRGGQTAPHAGERGSRTLSASADTEARQNGRVEADTVSESSRESFPASDSPTWSVGSN